MVEMQSVREAAIAWHLRLPDMPASAWEQFVDWLEQGSEHRAAYEEIVAADMLAAEGLSRTACAGLGESEPPLPQARPIPALLRRHARALGLGLAACLAVIAAVGLWSQASPVQLEQTRPGNTRQFAFVDGTRIDLNGDSALAMDEATPRKVRLDRGEARFAVRHSAEPFTVSAGGFAMRDLGTVFNVRLTERELVLDVVEGAVLFDPGGADLTVGAGEQVAVDRARNLVVKRDHAAAGDWLRGDFAFSDASLADVVAALHRRYGIEVTLGAGLSERPFTGNIRLSGDAAVDVPHLAGLIGAQVHREAEGWVITDTAGRR